MLIQYQLMDSWSSCSRQQVYFLKVRGKAGKANPRRTIHVMIITAVLRWRSET